MVLSWARQVAALAKKELLLLLRAPKKSVTELVAPVLVVVLLGSQNAVFHGQGWGVGKGGREWRAAELSPTETPQSPP